MYYQPQRANKATPCCPVFLTRLIVVFSSLAIAAFLLLTLSLPAQAQTSVRTATKTDTTGSAVSGSVAPAIPGGQVVSAAASGVRSSGDQSAGGLVVSDALRAQFQSLRQAVDNTKFTTGSIGTAERNLTEVKALLNQVQQSALFAPTSGGTAGGQIAGKPEAAAGAVRASLEQAEALITRLNDVLPADAKADRTKVSQLSTQLDQVLGMVEQLSSAGKEVKEAVAPAGQTTPSPEVLLDETVKLDELGAKPAKVLPDSPLHAFKRLGWNIQEAITVDPIKDSELKHKHAIQQLGEVKQMLEAKGVAGVAPQVIERNIERFQDKLEAVQKSAAKLKEAKQTDPASVETLLNDLTDKQIKQQKVLDSIVKNVVEVKEEAKRKGEVETRLDVKGVDQVLATVQQTKIKAAEEFVKVLAKVEDSPEQVSARLSQAIARQTGSSLRDLKHLEVLDMINKAAPQTMQAAVALARKNTIEQFEERIKEVPQAVRTEKLKQYVEYMTVDETKLFKLLDEMKQSSNVSSDVLGKIEEVKEIVVKKFEKKLAALDIPAAEKVLANGFNPEKGEDIVAMEEFRQRMTANSQELRLMKEMHDKSIAMFKEKFTDAKSEEHAALFQGLSKQVFDNPSPKTFKFIRDLELEVRSDPSKSAFLDKIGKEAQKYVEERYAREGDRFMERFASLDPKDIAVVQVVDFDPAFKDKLLKHKADKLKEFAREIKRPEEFDRFYERFYSTPDAVISKIKEADPEFQQAMQFKWRKIEQQRLEEERERQLAFSRVNYQERELHHQFDRLERKKDEEFWSKLNQVKGDNFDARKRLWEEKINDTYVRLDQRSAEQKQLFEERLKLDPFGCDEICRKIQLQSLEQDTRHQRERLADDLRREQNRVEVDKLQFQRNNPLANKCTTAESCKEYCRANKQLPECGWLVEAPPTLCPPPSYWDPVKNSCITPVIPDCGVGRYWDGQTCVADPYYRPPRDFRVCGPGMRWFEDRGICVPDRAIDCSPRIDLASGQVSYLAECRGPAEEACGKGERWEPNLRRCVSLEYRDCGPGSFFNFVSKQCERDNQAQSCRQGQRWDERERRCVTVDIARCLVPAVVLPACPDGQYRESTVDQNGCWLPGACVPIRRQCSNEPFPCPLGLARDSWVRPDGCTEYGQCTPPICPQFMPRVCAPGEKPAPPDLRNNPCAQPSCIPPDVNKCPLYDPYTKPCPAGEKREFTTDANGCQVPGKCLPISPPTPCPVFLDPRVAICQPGHHFEIVPGPVGCPGGSMCVPDDGRKGYCGDRICANGETEASCPADCRQASICPSNSYTIFDSQTPGGRGRCNYSQCTNGCTFDNAGCPTGCAGVVLKSCEEYKSGPECATNSRCDWYDASRGGYGCKVKGFVGVCGDGVCQASESLVSCPKDCGTQPTQCPASPYNNSVAGSAVCSYSVCPNGCVFNSSGCPTGCKVATGSCADHLTEPTCKVYPACEWYVPAAGSPTCRVKTTTATCGNNVCEGGETTATCPNDCKATTTSCTNTPSLCTTEATCKAANYFWCNGACQTAAACSTTGICPSNIANDYTQTKTCSSLRCPNGCNFDSQGCPTACKSATDISCTSQTTSPSCIVYPGCEWYTPATGTPVCRQKTTTTAVCGNNVCDSSETQVTCPADCGGTTACLPTMYNNYSATSVCSATQCPTGCVFDAKGCPTGCKTTTTGCGTHVTDATCRVDTTCEWHTPAAGSPYCRVKTTTTACTTPATCTTESACKAANYFWCNGACQTAAACSTTGICPSNMANDYTQTKTCSATKCPNGCTFDSQGCPSGCSSTTLTGCASYTTSPSCIVYPACEWYVPPTGSPTCRVKTTTATCGNNVCESSETPATCPSDCGATTACLPTIYNNLSATSVCSATQCPNGCVVDSKGCPTGCKTIATGCGTHVTDATCNTNTTCEWHTPTTGSPYCRVKTITTACTTPAACTTESACKAASFFWCNGVCQSTACTTTSCANTPSLCTTEATCKASNYFWCGTYCQTAACPVVTTCPANMYNDFSRTTTCSSITCPSGCSFDAQGCPKACVEVAGSCTTPATCTTQSTCTGKGFYWCTTYCSSATCPITGTACNNNRICDAGETPATCPGDCSTTTATCNHNGICDGTETVATCSDCHSVSTGCNNNRVCDAGETMASCPTDCGTSTITSCNNNRICDAGETMATCPGDCPSTSSAGSICRDCASCKAAGCPKPSSDPSCVSFVPSSCPSTHTSFAPGAGGTRFTDAGPLQRFGLTAGEFVRSLLYFFAKATMGF